MSIFFPYSPAIVLAYYTTLFGIDLTSLTGYETLTLTIYSNIYFFVYWFVIVYFSLKIFNRIWERFL